MDEAMILNGYFRMILVWTCFQTFWTLKLSFFQVVCWSKNHVPCESKDHYFKSCLLEKTIFVEISKDNYFHVF